MNVCRRERILVIHWINWELLRYNYHTNVYFISGGSAIPEWVEVKRSGLSTGLINNKAINNIQMCTMYFTSGTCFIPFETEH